MDSKEQTILTIDLDFLFPKMNLIESTKLSKFSITEYLDKFNLDFVKSILRHFEGTKVQIVESHEEVLFYIDKNKEINLINLDFHHDFGYNEEQISCCELNNFSELQQVDQEASWVLFLYLQYKLKSYTWLGSEESEFELSLLKHGFKIHLEKGSTFKPYDFELPIKVDKIIICKSLNYINERQVNYAINELHL